MKLKSLLILIFIIFTFGVAFSSENAYIKSFSPQGTVKGVTQVKAVFSEQMVNFGDLNAPSPFDIKCDTKGKGIWIDDRTWIYDFEKELPAGIKCEFNLTPTAKTITGKEIKGQRSFIFSTGGPSIIFSYPREIEGIDENQAFILNLDAEPDENSVLENAYCLIEGVNERVGIRIIKGEDRDKILKSAVYAQEIGDSLKVYMVIQCKRSFPSNSKIKIVWGKGISSLNGVKNEKEQILNFKTRNAFSINFRCAREKQDSGCIPLLPMRVLFSSPVSIDYAEKIILKGGGRLYKPSKYEGDYYEEEENSKPEFIREVIFKGPFPEKASFILEIPKDIKDEDGRIPINLNNFPLTVKTEEYPPLAKFSARFGIIELNGNSTLPVTLRNIEPELKTKLLKIEDNEHQEETFKETIYDKAKKALKTLKSKLSETIFGKDGNEKEDINGKLYRVPINKELKIIEWLKVVEKASRRNPILKNDKETKEFYLPKPSGSKAFEVIGIPLKEPGFYVIELESEILGASLLGQRKPLYVQTSALVTNLSAHFKWGRENSLVWVTTLDRAEPVRDAEVHIRDCTGRLVWSGKTDVNGIAYIKQQLPSPKTCKSDIRNEDNYMDSSQLQSLRGIYYGYFVFVKKDKDLSFVHSSWDDGIEPWRFKLPDIWDYEKIKAHTVFDRTLLRAGETLHMKHIIRKRTIEGFEYVNDMELPNKLLIQHQGSEQSYEFPIRWDKNGIAESSWSIPKDAKLGNYEVFLCRNEGKKNRKYDESSLFSGSFRVEEFRVSLMKGIIKPLSQPLINPSKLELDILVAYLSGGGFSNGNVKIRAKPYQKKILFEDYEDFTFSNGELKERILTEPFYEESLSEEEKQKVYSREIALDKTGSAKIVIDEISKISSPKDMHVEIEFRDQNGEINTVSTRIPIYPSTVLVGISPDSWMTSKEKFRFKVLALDLHGKPLSDIPVKVDILKKKYYTHRKRLIGGFYSYEHVTEIKNFGEICKGKTDKLGFLICDVKSPVAGNVILQAYATDKDGNKSVAHRDLWIVDKESVWFDVSDSDRIDLIPEKKRYYPGEKVRLQLRMPFREATALVTVEREGILDTYIKRLSNKNPVVEIPVKSNYAPNVFISALCIRGRVSDIKPSATVDLGKPAFKLGYTEIKIGWDAYELKVNISTDKKIYRVREKAYAKIKVTKKDGTPLKEKGEITLAAVDEGLLELMPNKSWQILESMMGRRPMEVKTSTAHMQVVGKRHFGLKAVPQGGGGGKQITRELFDTLLLWKGRVPLDEKGEATVEIPLNDSITSFRLVAVAHTGKGQFGTGETSIRTTQELIIISGLPPFVREGDRFFAGFTLRNTKENEMEVLLTAFLNGNSLEEKSVKLQSGESKEIGWEIQVPNSVNSLQWEVTALDKVSNISDRIKIKQNVGVAIPVKTYQATLRQLDNSLKMDIEKPKEALLDRGGLRIAFTSKISDGLYGVYSYMRDYSYTCLEQKVSIAVALRDRSFWNRVMLELPSYIDSEGLLKYFPSMFYGSDVLTSYVLAISHEAGFQIPSKLKESMLEGLSAFIEGRIRRAIPVSAVDLTIRKILAIEALSRYDKAKIEYLSTININPNLLPTSAVLDWINILIRLSNIPERDKKLKEAQEIIRARLDLRGAKLSFSSSSNDNLWWLMVSEDLNSLKSILTLMNLKGWEEDIPKLVNGALGILKSGHWDTTTANAWGVLAIKKFSDKYESIKINGKTSVILDKEQRNIEWDKNSKEIINFSWKHGKENLSIEHKGSGKPWVIIQSLLAVPLKKPVWSGYTIKKKIIPVEQKFNEKWSVGDILKVVIEFESKADMTWVVVNDPVPAGASILRMGLGRESSIVADKRKTAWLNPSFEERSFDSYRAYYEYLPRGRWTVEYIMRLNNSGLFHLPQTRVEALYYPDMFGELPNGSFEIH